MDKRGEEERTILWAFYLLLVGFVVITTIFMIDRTAEASGFSDRYVSLDTSLLLNTAQLSPGKLNLNYQYGDRNLDISGNKISSNKIFSTYSPNINLLIREQKKNLAIRTTDFVFPVNQKIVTSCFGNRQISEGTSYHEGVDLRANYEDVFVIEEGIIKTYVNGAGTENSLTIEHRNGVITRYLHLDKLSKEIKLSGFNCVENCEVRKGELIAKSGQHGPKSHTQYEPHLHFELVINGKVEDPINYFDPNSLSFKSNSNCFDNMYAYSYKDSIERNEIT